MDFRRDFGRARRLLRKKQFDDVLRRASVRTGRGPLRLAARDNELEMARLGLIVGKRMLPRAVDRNRAKRVIRESFRQAGGLPAMDIVVRVAVPAAAITVADADRLFRALAEIVDRRRRLQNPHVG
ncbi:MAG: ribonuclease P protein component [Gammaproteobacteria bacterium]|nr:ribonuclease P protein component [Gammaproteobacteria bacterium]MXY56329.1 ribonuclease P protein component [Gammaproteobacteria bacterium]MYF28184.1 ribonuclease P protein component [Gammaproteobacteria bacterium]MYK47732.1 ribonuclease P protein component [Gammaproteobacteria bacterium]